MGVRELRQGVEALVGHDHHPLLVVVVEAEDHVAEQLELERGDVLVRLEQPERPQRRVVLGLLLGRIVLLEEGEQRVLELVAREQLRRADVGGGQAADGDHLLLDLGEGGQDVVLVRR